MSVRKGRTIPSQTEHFARAAVFAAVARTGSFSAAARDLGLARSTISDHVRTLEQAFGVRLLERTTRRVRLTEDGEALLARLEPALDAWGEVVEVLESPRDEPAGTLRVTAPGLLAGHVVGPVLSEMMARWSALAVDLRVEDQVCDLASERVDVAIRMAALADSTLVARKLGETPRVFVAAPSFASRCTGGPDVLATLPWVGHGATRPSSVMVHDTKAGERCEVVANYRAMGSNSEGVMSLVEGGVGVALMPALLVRDALEEGRVERVYPLLDGGTVPLFALYPSREHIPAKLRVFLDAMVEAVWR